MMKTTYYVVKFSINTPYIINTRKEILQGGKMNNLKKVGAMWQHRSKKDNKLFLSGEIEIDGIKKRVLLFRNTLKENDKHPDWNILFQDLSAEDNAQIDGIKTKVIQNRTDENKNNAVYWV